MFHDESDYSFEQLIQECGRFSINQNKPTIFSSRYALIHLEVMETATGVLGKVLSSLSCRKSLSQNDPLLDFNFYDLQRFSGLWNHSQLKLN